LQNPVNPGNTQRLYIPWRKGEGASIAGGKNYELLYTYRKKCRFLFNDFLARDQPTLPRGQKDEKFHRNLLDFHWLLPAAKFIAGGRQFKSGVRTFFWTLSMPSIPLSGRSDWRWEMTRSNRASYKPWLGKAIVSRQ